MVIYICPRCNYKINNLTKYIKHLKRKKICNPILSKTNLQKEYIKYDIKEKININNNTTKNVEISTKMWSSTKYHKIPHFLIIVSIVTNFLVE